jgi:predicted GNAT family acetyltransferase
MGWLIPYSFPEFSPKQSETAGKSIPPLCPYRGFVGYLGYYHLNYAQLHNKYQEVETKIMNPQL